MPSTYAHYRLGQEVLQKVDIKQKEIIENNIELFNIGLHGPDILFYFNPLFINDVNKVGYGLHEKTGLHFFKKASNVLKKSKFSEPYLAYIYGFICHFALDTACHKYIDIKIEESGVSHVEIETELDRELLIIDGYNPVKQCLTNHINASMRNAKIISGFFERVEDFEVKKALKSMIFYNKFLLAPSKFKRNIIMALLKITGNYDDMHGLFINSERNEKCVDSTLKLLELYDLGKKNAVYLINEFEDCARGKLPFSSLYSYTFGSQLGCNELKEAAYEI